MWISRLAFVMTVTAMLVSVGCGGGNPAPPPPPPTITVSVTPSSQSVLLGATQQFTATVTGTTNTNVTWSVNGVSGGNATVGTISSSGFYTAPKDLPNPAKVTVTGTSQADTSKHADASVAVTSDIAVAVSSSPVGTQAVPTASTLQFAASITSAGNPDKSVTWAVNGIPNGNGTVGTIDGTGLYTAPPTVPTPFTVNISATSVADSAKSASTGVIVAGTIASVTQTISAAQGGTITLPDGSGVTIPPNALAADQTVTLSEVSFLPQQPPNQLVVGVGPALSLKLSVPNPVPAALPKLKEVRRLLFQSQTSSTDVQFTIVMGPNAVSTLQGSAPMTDLQSPSGVHSFLFVSGAFDSANQIGTVSFDPSFLSGVQEIDATMANFNSTIPVATLPLEVYWDGHQFQKLPPVPGFVCPLPDSLVPANGKILVLVHGMLSTVEHAFSKASEIQTVGGYGVVTGFDYDWTQRIQDPSNPMKTSGSALAAFLDSLALCSGVKQIDIEAHSEGVPVTLAAGGLLNPKTTQVIKTVVSIAGPIKGTPLANAPHDFLSAYLNAPGGVVLPGLIAGRLALLDGLPPLQDLTDIGDPLANLRQQFASKLPDTRLIVVGGDKPLPLGPFNATLSAIFAGHPNDTVIPLDSALGFGSGLKVYPLPPFHDNHWALHDDDAVINAIGVQVTEMVAPSLLFSPPNGCSATLTCSGFPGTSFALGGNGYTANGSILRYEQFATGQVIPLSSVLTPDGAIPSSAWQDSTTCSDPPTTKVFFAQDAATGRASNAVTESLTQPGAGSVPLMPQAPSVRGGTTQAFTAGLPPCASSVAWTVNGVPGGDSTNGTIDMNGVYTAPIPLPSSNAVTVSVSATIGSATATGSTTVNLLNPIPVLSSVSPNVIGLGPFTLTLTGSQFVPGAVVNFGGSALSSTTTFVSSTQLTASGTATTSQANSSVAVSVTNPYPDSPISNLLGVSVVNSNIGGSGSTAIIGNKAYVPIASQGTIAVLNVDSTTSTGAVFTSIPMPLGYQPSATAANPVTKEVVVVSFGSADIQIIDAVQDKLVATYTSPVTQFAGFSGGSCLLCGALVDPSTNRAILDTAQGPILFNPTTGQFGPFLPALAAENFAFNSNSRIAVLPTYSQLGFTGLQALNVDTGAVSQYSASVGSVPDSAAVDLTTNLVVIPDEFTDNQYLINMQAASFSGGSFSAPQTVFPVPISSISSCNEWTMVSVESGSHVLFLANEFGGSTGGSFLACAAVETMPTSSVSGAPPLPAVFHWGSVPNTPDGFPWLNSFDPHGIAVFTSVLNGRAYGFLVNRDQTWVARIDLDGVRNAALVPGGLNGQVNLTPYVFFIQTH